jgi:CRP-like cAMP-binding protein
MSVKAEAEVFRKIPLFADADRAHLQVIAFASERADFARGQAIITQGVRGAAAYLILKGHADVMVRDSDETHPVGRVEPGAFVGELAMIADLPYSVSVIARDAVATARIPRALFMRVAGEFPEFGSRVHAALARRLSGTTTELLAARALFDRASSFVNRPVK